MSGLDGIFNTVLLMNKGYFFLIVLSLFALCSCERIFFYPMKEMVFDPGSVGIEYASHRVPVHESEHVYIWELYPKGEEQGTIVHFHGNAENISTHIGSVAWLSEEGYRVFLMDYRGFGGSDGVATVRNAVMDIRKTLEWVQARDNLRRPLVVFAQSIGASLSLYAASDIKYRNISDAMIFESPFLSYRKIAREKMEDTIVLYPFSWFLSFLFTSCCSPLEGGKTLDGIPLRMILIEDDKVVGAYHSRALFEAIPSDDKKLWVVPEGGHNSFMSKSENRRKVLDFIKSLPAD